MISLNELKSIKPRQIKLLQENGITSVAALAMSSPDELAEIDGMSEKASKILVWDARHELGMGEFRSVSEMEIHTKYITTGSKNLDGILGNWNATGYIMNIFGVSVSV